MNYYLLDAEDLAADDYFKEWVSSPTPDADAFWKTFLHDYPERYYQIEEARQLVTALREIQDQPEQTARVEGIWKRIEQTLEPAQPARLIQGINWLRGWQVAALLLMTLSAGWLGLNRLKGSPAPKDGLVQANNDWIETLNEASQSMQIQLADGSLVKLLQGGRLRYRKELVGPQREVYLTGEAFFQVRKNPTRPFIVYANGLVTKVLGTSFRINAPVNASTVTVDVKTGRVSVYANQPSRVQDPESKGMVLTPNQKAVFHRDAATLDKILVDSPSLLISRKESQQFVFEDTPVAQIFSAIERAYGVDVIFDEEVMQHCSLTLSLDDEDLFQKLDVICKVLNAQYKLIDAQIVIYSEGCRKSM
ncbi:FecR family protein [Spirosoma utsteinense]|uniref:Ferric-dicitrate binding protein FerR (Iron transport regulator) n=1 Tax=Spirosoma utsteinense TaxID=2585773 RepID=A0ABR6WFR6_9BACT|nr:FecR domain-containing protein [Spirosoma utsteinense]MBC3788811.1 ferric-dicitrate binding protein FerR (iron transport regulator) [Spirosoma utsteinense]MBC3794861.1 ferric-dicitrate binding protein FerR (iron transport regulator) [Spirosoma utsteinense]